MKYKLSILMIAAFAALSCSKERVEQAGDGGGKTTTGISFATKVTVPDVTRGTMVNGVGQVAAAGGFRVWAYSHTAQWASNPAKTTMMDGIPVTSGDGGTTWTYGSAQEWPLNDYVSFFAYVPIAGATQVPSGVAGTLPTIEFAVDDDVADQTDLLIAAPRLNQNGAAYYPNNAVSITFHHALSRISFSGLKTDPSDTRKIKVKSITINGLYHSGSTSLTSYPADWTLDGDDDGDASYTVSIEDNMLEDLELKSTLGTGETYNITSASGYLFLMPQTLARTADDPTMTVELSIDDGISEEVTSYTRTIFSPTAWEPGKSYNYQIVVDGNDLRIIRIDSGITLGDWTGGIVLQTLPLTSDRDEDAANLFFCMTVLEDINRKSTTTRYEWFGAYGVNDVNHDIEIDVAYLSQPANGGLFQSFGQGQHLVFDLKKLTRTWGTDSSNGNAPWEVSITNYASEGWALSDAWQPIDVVGENIDTSQPASTGKYITEVDGVAGATLSATQTNTFQLNGGGTVDIPLTNVISNKGSIIIVKQQP